MTGQRWLASRAVRLADGSRLAPGDEIPPAQFPEAYRRGAKPALLPEHRRVVAVRQFSLGLARRAAPVLPGEELIITARLARVLANGVKDLGDASGVGVRGADE